MRASFVIFLAFAHIAFLVGCGKSEKTDETHSSQVGGNQVSSNTVDMVHAPEVACTGSVARTLAELDVEFASISNYVYSDTARANGAGMRMRDKLMTLPPALGEQYARKMLNLAFSFPVGHVLHHGGSLDAMWDVGGWAWWQGANQVFYCEKLILKFTLYRDAIDYVRKNDDGWRQRCFSAMLLEDLRIQAEFYEKQLAYRLSSQIPPRDYAHLVEEVPDEQFAIIKAKFEKFLGRPIRTYEEIVRAQREHDRQMKLEEERRRGGPDVKVDVGDL